MHSLTCTRKSNKKEFEQPSLFASRL